MRLSSLCGLHGDGTEQLGKYVPTPRETKLILKLGMSQWGGGDKDFKV
jgi:hypothetical protein